MRRAMQVGLEGRRRRLGRIVHVAVGVVVHAVHRPVVDADERLVGLKALRGDGEVGLERGEKQVRHGLGSGCREAVARKDLILRAGGGRRRPSGGLTDALIVMVVPSSLTTGKIVAGAPGRP